MAVQGPKADDSGDEDVGLFAEINITPLTDVILVLLIIFMVSSSAMVDAVREGRLDVQLPQAGSAATDAAETESLVVGITVDDQIFVHGEAVNDQQLEEILVAQRKKNPATTVILQADGSLEHKHVVHVIELVRKVGFASVGIGTEAD